MVNLSNLKPAPGAVKNRKRVGRGYGSGTGKTAARGSNGQKSRAGYSRLRGFEGGQMPLVRRLPKRGFTNIFKKEFNIVNLESIEKLGLSEVTLDVFFQTKLAKNPKAQVKVLGLGELTRGVKVHAHCFSKSAVEKISKAGGEAVVLKGE